MSRYEGQNSYNKSQSSFASRVASLKEDRKILAQASEQEEFNSGYAKGKLRLSLASKLNLTPCGLERYVEADKGTVWKREGDTIVRVDQDLDWIDQALEEEANR